MRIVDGAAADIPRLEPLWLAMVAHHSSCGVPAAEAVPFRAPQETWTRRRARYEQWIGQPAARLLIAEDEDTGQAIGYSMLRVGGGEATVATGERVGELESLSVAPHARGQGVGSALIDAAFAHFREQGATEMTLSVMAGNEAAQRLYERHGLRPYYLAMLGRIPDAAERT